MFERIILNNAQKSPTCILSRVNGLHRQSEDAMLLHSSETSIPIPENEFNQETEKCLFEGKDLIQKLESYPVNLGLISSFVQKHKDTMLPLKMDGLYLQICDLNGTIYMGQKFMLEGWQHLYLPKGTQMEVLGTMQCSGGMAPTLQWVILVAEDGKVYAYEDEVLHLISRSLKQLIEEGFQRIEKSYPCQHDVSDEETVQKNEDVQSIKHRTRNFVDQHTDEFGDFLSFIVS